MLDCEILTCLTWLGERHCGDVCRPRIKSCRRKGSSCLCRYVGRAGSRCWVAVVCRQEQQIRMKVSRTKARAEGEGKACEQSRLCLCSCPRAWCVVVAGVAFAGLDFTGSGAVSRILSDRCQDLR